MTKKNPVLEDPQYWRYQGIVESFANLLMTHPYVLADKEELQNALAHVARKIYKLGEKEGLKNSHHDTVLLQLDQNTCIKTRGVYN